MTKNDKIYFFSEKNILSLTNSLKLLYLSYWVVGLFCLAKEIVTTSISSLMFTHQNDSFDTFGSSTCHFQCIVSRLLWLLVHGKGGTGNTAKWRVL